MPVIVMGALAGTVAKQTAVRENQRSRASSAPREAPKIRVAVLTAHAASRKEPLAALLEGHGPGSPRAGEGVAFSTLLAVAAGVPRSFPFHGITINLHVPAFGDLVSQAGVAVGMTPGVTVTDSWWVSGRMRSLVSLVIADADLAGATLPPAPEPVAAILAACGRPTSVRQIPIEPPPERVSSSQQDGSPKMTTAVRAIVQDHRARLVEIVERAGLPHDLRSGREALSATQLG